MNNPIPFFNPFNNPFIKQDGQDNYEKLINKIERLEKSIRILENKVSKLENENIKPNNKEEPSDMYMI